MIVRTRSLLDRLAIARLARERRGLMSEGSLINRVYIRLKGARPGRYEQTEQFIAALRTAMDHTILDEVRKRRAQKRQHECTARDVDTIATSGHADDLRLDLLDDALHTLERSSTTGPRKCRVFQLVFLERMSCDDAAAALGVSARTVHRDAVVVEQSIREIVTTGPIGSHAHRTNGAARPDVA
jgi:RNA polymerase sigma factor (sigma-70 family)